MQALSRMGTAANPGSHAALLNRSADYPYSAANQHVLLHLQRQYGNRYVNQVLQQAQQISTRSSPQGSVQTKLTIGPAGDKYEREADRVASDVVQRINSPASVVSAQGHTLQAKQRPDEEVQAKTQITAIQREVMPGEDEQQAQMKPVAALLQANKTDEEDQLKHLHKKSATPAEHGHKDEDEDKLKHLQKKSEVSAGKGMKEEDEDKLPVHKKSHQDVGPHKKPEEDNEKHLMQTKSEVSTGHQDKDEEDTMAQMQPLVQRRTGEIGTAATPDLESSIKYARGKGRPLPEHVRGAMEQAFGADFSGVKVHTGSHADQLNRSIQARAFTTGQDVFFRQGEFSLGSKRGQELLAHELTHVVQQNGSAVEPKVNQAAEAKARIPDSPSKEGMMVSQPSPDTGIQRKCSKCEQERKQLNKEDETEGTIQAKALSTPSAGVGIQSPVASAQVAASTGQQSWADFTEGQTVREGIDGDRSLNGNAGKLSPFNPGVSDRPPSTPQARTQAIENVLAVKEKTAELNAPGVAQSVEIASPPEPPPVVEVGSKPTGEETSPIEKAVESASVPQEKLSLPKEATAEAEKEPTQGEALEKVPEVRALEEVMADKQADNLLPEGKGEAGEAASPKTAAEKEQSTKEASKAQAQLDEKNAQAEQSASTGINFVLPKNAITIQGEGVPAFLKRRRAIASRIADQFLAAATSRVQKITQLGQEISAPIHTAAENAKASITATVEQQRAEMTAQIAQQREQAQSAAHEIQAEIQNQYQTAVTTISQTTADNRQQVETEHTSVLQTLDGHERDQIAKVDDLYARTDKQCRDTGVQVGDDAIVIGEEMAQAWESQIKGHDDTIWDGPLTDNRLRARANAAREVVKQYKPALTENANKYADEVQKNKANDMEGIQKTASESRQTLQTQKTNALDAFNTSEQQALSKAQAAQTNFTEAAKQSLQATLQSLDQEEATQSQLLTAYGQRQVLAIDRDTQQAIASLQEGVNQAATNLQEMLHNIEAEMQGKETPDLNRFSSVLAELLDQVDEAVATAQTETSQGITASQQGINDGGQKAVAGIAPIAQAGIEQAQATTQGLKTTLADLKQGATTTFTEIQQTQTTTITNITKTTLEAFQQVTQSIQTAFEQITQKLDNSLQQSVKDLEKGLRDSFGEMRAKIQEEANKAADQEQPSWKGWLKILITIAVVVAVIAVTIVAGPAGIAAGIAFGAVMGAAAGAVIQMSNNLIDGKNVLDGVGQAMLVGAIGGAMGGLGGALGQAFAAGKGLVQAGVRFGLDTAFDVGGGVLGDLAVGNPITLEGVLIGAAIGAGVSIGIAGAVKVKGVVSGKGDISTGSRPNTEVLTVKRPELEVKDSAIGMKSPETRGLSTHYDKPEIKNKPGVVAEQKAINGHTYKVLSDGRVVRCTSCTRIDLDQKTAQHHIPKSKLDKVSKKVKQANLGGRSKKKGKKTFFAQPANQKQNELYVRSETTVYASLKINGVPILLTRNTKAAEQLEFEMCPFNQKGPKDNPHAEDWMFASFKAMNPDLNVNITSNTGARKPVVSMRINFSPCLGCVKTLIAFKQHIAEKLDSSDFIFRVKFLRPYDLNKTLANVESQQGKNFVKAVQDLMEAGIGVRLQPLLSARKQFPFPNMTEKSIKEKQKPIVTSWNYLTKTWKELELNRK